MREDLAAVNVTRTYTLAASNIAIFTFMLFFLYPKFESGTINPLLFQLTLIAMGIATFALVFATLHYYRCSLGGAMSDAERMLHLRRADRFWLLGYTTMFLAPSLVLFLIGLWAVASVWLAFWLVYLFFVVRYFPRIQTPREFSSLVFAIAALSLSLLIQPATVGDGLVTFEGSANVRVIGKAESLEEIDDAANTFQWIK